MPPSLPHYQPLGRQCQDSKKQHPPKKELVGTGAGKTSEEGHAEEGYDDLGSW